MSTNLTSSQCRFCLKACSAFARNVNDLVDLYHELFGFTISDADIPRRVCLNCDEQIQAAHAFYSQCLETERVLGTEIPLKKEEEEEIETLDDDLDFADFKDEPLETAPPLSSFFSIDQEVEAAEEFVESYSRVQKRYLPESMDDEIYEVTSAKKMKCDYCDFGRNCASTLRTHIHREHPNYTLKYCKKCSKSFPAQSLLEAHFSRSACGGDDLSTKDSFTCSFCDYKNNEVIPLKEHLRRRHPHAKRINCPWCSYITHNFDRLRHHAKVHRKFYPPFSALNCDNCTFTCSYEENMKMHCQNYHPNVLVPCECGDNFVCRDLRLQHLLLSCTLATDACRQPFEQYLVEYDKRELNASVRKWEQQKVKIETNDADPIEIPDKKVRVRKIKYEVEGGPVS